MFSNKIRVKTYFFVAVFSLKLLLETPGILAFNVPGSSDMPLAVQVNGKNIFLQNLNPSIPQSEQAIFEGSRIYIKNYLYFLGIAN